LVLLFGSSAGVAAQLGWAMEGKLLVGQRSVGDEMGERGGGGSTDSSTDGPVGLSADSWVIPAARTGAGYTTATM
jgi:hypothetical protein